MSYVKSLRGKESGIDYPIEPRTICDSDFGPVEVSALELSQGFIGFSGVVETPCRFRDCRHDGEPGCAVADAVANGTLDAGRLRRFRKLAAEEAFNSATLAERRARDKTFGKMVKRVMNDKKRKHGG